MRVPFIVTCLNDAMFPETGQAVVRLLLRLGSPWNSPGPDLLCPADDQPGYLNKPIPVVRTFVEAFRQRRHPPHLHDQNIGITGASNLVQAQQLGQMHRIPASVLTRSPDGRWIFEGATISHPIPAVVNARASPRTPDMVGKFLGGQGWVLTS